MKDLDYCFDCVAEGRGCSKHLLALTLVEHIPQTKLNEVYNQAIEVYEQKSVYLIIYLLKAYITAIVYKSKKNRDEAKQHVDAMLEKQLPNKSNLLQALYII
jgi:hypothetical protein